MPRKFGSFFPQFAPYLSRILRDNCTDEHQAYLTQPDPWANYHANNVVSCLLDHFDESGKAQLAVSSVLLGLLPTILGMVGSSTSEIGLLALRRPVLAFLLSFGSPVVSHIRSFEYRDPIEVLQPKEGSIPKDVVRHRRILLLEYVVTLVAIGNMVHVIYQLCWYSVCAFSASTPWLLGM